MSFTKFNGDRTPSASLPMPGDLPKFIIFDTKFIISYTKSIVFNAKFIILNQRFDTTHGNRPSRAYC